MHDGLLTLRRTVPMPRRVHALRSALAVVLLAVASTAGGAMPDIAWEVRVLTAPWVGDAPDRPELLLDAGSDALDREIAIKQGSFLGAITGMPLGRTEEAGAATVVFAMGEAFTVESDHEAPAFTLDIDPKPNPGHDGSWTVDFALSVGKSFKRERTLPLHPHRARLWVLPHRDGVVAILSVAWPANQRPHLRAPEDTVRVDLALVRGDWRRGVPPSSVVESDFPTWVDPFELQRGETATALMRPVSAGAADAGTLLFSHSMKVPLDELGAYQRGRRPGEGAPGGKDFLSATVSVKEAQGEAARLVATVSLQSPHFGAGELVMLRRFELGDGATQVWIVPTEDALQAMFLRVRRGARGLAHPVRPGG
jgi:hypothetical protein